MGEDHERPVGVIGGARAGVAALRTSVARLHRAIALGFAAVVVSSMLGVALAFNVFSPLATAYPLSIQNPYVAQMVRAFELQISLLIVLPPLAWAAGWVFDGSPRALCVGAAVFHEIFQGLVVASSEGSEVFLHSPLFFGTRLLLALGIGLVAARTFAHARGRLVAASDGRRRKAPEPAAASAVPAAADDEVLDDAEVEVQAASAPGETPVAP